MKMYSYFSVHMRIWGHFFLFFSSAYAFHIPIIFSSSLSHLLIFIKMIAGEVGMNTTVLLFTHNN
jgi:hypothetical protein